MYFQLTERCNMTCAHCCFAATTRGPDMSHEVFAAAMALVEARGDYLTLGGGEPTVHKHFFDFLDYALRAHNRGRLELPPMVITNGKLKGKARRLLDMVEAEHALHVELSQDSWHDPIDPEIVARFQGHERARQASRWSAFPSSDGTAGIRTVQQIIPVGRGADLIGKQPGREVQCCCEDLLVDPLGTIGSCGCKHTQLGSVFDTSIADQLWDYDWDYAHQGGFPPEEGRLAA